jgi:peptide/nickel transport system permease protein
MMPWLCLAPSGMVMILVLSFNFLGDALRDILDPRRKEL